MKEHLKKHGVTIPAECYPQLKKFAASLRKSAGAIIDVHWQVDPNSPVDTELNAKEKSMVKAFQFSEKLLASNSGFKTWCWVEIPDTDHEGTCDIFEEDAKVVKWRMHGCN